MTEQAHPLVEVRLPGAGDIDRVLGSGADAVGIGHEGCLHKARHAGALVPFVRHAHEAGLAASVVVPVAWPRSAAAVATFAHDAAAAGADTLVVNDWATALECRPYADRLVLGRGLTASRPLAVAEEPTGTAEPVHSDLDVGIQDAVGEGAALGVELDAATPPRPETLCGQLRLVVGPRLRALSRSCPTLRHRHGTAGRCEALCTTPITVTATSRWRLVDGKRETLPAGTPARDLLVWGNAVLDPASTTPDRVAAPVRVWVIDLRYVAGELAEEVSALRTPMTPPPSPTCRLDPVSAQPSPNPLRSST